MNNYRKKTRCVIYTRKSTEEGLDQEFNSLDAQREACEAYVRSQAHEGWVLIEKEYNDGGFSGGNANRPALQELMADIKSRNIDLIIVYKVDRLTRSLADFSKMVDTFDNYGVSFVSITQQFNTSTSMGRLTLNVLLSFAQFEREVTSERIRDKVSASKQKGMWMGGYVPLGYDNVDKSLHVNDEEARVVNYIFSQYLKLGSVKRLKKELDAKGIKTKLSKNGRGGCYFSRGALYALLKNITYLGQIKHKNKVYPGNHTAIIDTKLWSDVQKQLTDNKQATYDRTEAKEPALLAGLLFDEQDNYLSPTHTRKNNRRYKYYVNQTLIQFKQVNDSSVTRVPAETLDQAIERNLVNLMGNKSTLANLLKELELSAINQQQAMTKGANIAEHFSSLPIVAKIKWVNRLIKRVTVSRTSLKIDYSISNIASSLLENTGFNIQSVWNIEIPVSLRRCGVETRLIIEDAADNLNQPHSDSLRAIQEAVKCGLEWNQFLITRKAESAKNIANRFEVSDRYVSQCVKLAFLSPEIIKRIFKGDIPFDMTLKKLKQGIPLDWRKQEMLFNR